MAEGGGLLNRYRGSTSIVSSNLIPSAKDCSPDIAQRVNLLIWQGGGLYLHVTPVGGKIRRVCYESALGGKRTKNLLTTGYHPAVGLLMRALSATRPRQLARVGMIRPLAWSAVLAVPHLAALPR